MTSAWITSSLILGLLVYMHAVYWQKSHGPIRSFWLRRDRSPLRCAVYVAIGGAFGAIEYAILCLLSRRPNVSASEIDSASGVSANDKEAMKRFWDEKFAEGLDAGKS